MQGRAALAPIFNQRKRQRKAMFTDANQPEPPSKMPDLMPVGGFTGGPRQPTFNRSSPGGLNQTANPIPRSTCHPNFGSNSGNKQSSINFNSSKPNNMAFNQSVSSANSFNHSISSTNNYNQSRTPTNIPKNYFNQTNNQGQNINQSNFRGGFNQSSNRNNFNQPTKSYGSQRQDSVGFGQNGPYSRQNQYGGATTNACRSSQNQQFQPNSPYDQQPANFDGSMPGNSGLHTVNSFDSRFQSTSMIGNTGSRLRSDYGHSVSSSSNWNSAFGNRHPPKQTMFSNDNRVNTFQPNVNTNTQQFRNNEKQMGQPTAKPKMAQKPPGIDKSLRIVTTDIEGFKKWGQRKGANMNLLFEIFGMVYSAVLLNQSGTGKEFVLKDGMDTMQCLFYEIDRSLPRLIRGQWHRCVGTYEGKTGKMKCVAVRPTGPEERKLAKITMYLSNKSLEGFTRAINEQ